MNILKYVMCAKKGDSLIKLGFLCTLNRRKIGITLACYLQVGLLPGKQCCQGLPKAVVNSHIS